MPVSYTKASGQGHVYQVPDYPEAADAPKAFKDYSDFLDLILPPVGTIMPFVGNTAPTGWLLCSHAVNNGEYSSTTYPKLSALCGTKFGTASAGNFKVPDLRGRVVAGLDTSQAEFDTIGKTGGAKTVTLTTSNMPSHNHTATLSGLTVSGLSASTEGDHGHSFSGTTTGSGEHPHTGTAGTVVTGVTATGVAFSTGSGSQVTRIRDVDVTTGSVLSGSAASGFGAGAHTHTYSGTTVSAGGHTHTISGTISGGTVTVANTGSGTAFDNTQPFVTMNHIIRAA